MSEKEDVIRYYKGKVPCVILIKSRMNYLIRFLEDGLEFKKGQEVTTVPRLLWRKPR